MRPRSALIIIIARFGWPSFLTQVQGSLGLHESAYNFIALVRAGIFMQSFQQALLSRKEFCNCGHLLISGSGSAPEIRRPPPDGYRTVSSVSSYAASRLDWEMMLLTAWKLFS